MVIFGRTCAAPRLASLFGRISPLGKDVFFVGGAVARVVVGLCEWRMSVESRIVWRRFFFWGGSGNSETLEEGRLLEMPWRMLFLGWWSRDGLRFGFVQGLFPPYFDLNMSWLTCCFGFCSCLFWHSSWGFCLFISCNFLCSGFSVGFLTSFGSSCWLRVVFFATTLLLLPTFLGCHCVLGVWPRPLYPWELLVWVEFLAAFSGTHLTDDQLPYSPSSEVVVLLMLLKMIKYGISAFFIIHRD